MNTTSPRPIRHGDKHNSDNNNNNNKAMTNSNNSYKVTHPSNQLSIYRSIYLSISIYPSIHLCFHSHFHPLHSMFHLISHRLCFLCFSALFIAYPRVRVDSVSVVGDCLPSLRDRLRWLWLGVQRRLERRARGREGAACWCTERVQGHARLLSRGAADEKPAPSQRGETVCRMSAHRHGIFSFIFLAIAIAIVADHLAIQQEYHRHHRQYQYRHQYQQHQHQQQRARVSGDGAGERRQSGQPTGSSEALALAASREADARRAERSVIAA